MEISAGTLGQVLEAYERGLCLKAYSLAQALGPLREWEGTEARLLAARLAAHVGAPRLSLALFLLAGRRATDDLRARTYYVRAVLSWRGPVAAWEALRRHPDPQSDDPQALANWLALHARVLGALRDFDAAEGWLARALEAAPGDPWVQVERAALCEKEDRYDGCLAASRRSLELRPWYLPGVHATAHALTLLGRDEEARELLEEGARRLESGPLVAQLAGLQIEQRRYADARRSLTRLAELSPLLEDELGQWLAARQADAAYYCGDFEAAADSARRVIAPFYQQFAERLSAPSSDGQRVLLPVGFVRQHHMTCCPATLSAIGRFWSKPAEHLSVAEEICYDGTPAYSERRWAERNGWRAREFTVCWESSVALLQRGVPFTLSTINATNAHMQAVIGYDACRGSLLVRDPFEPPVGEFPAEAMLENQRASGPRGMAMAPEERADLLEGLDLPESALYDRLYVLQGALFEHDRGRAREVYNGMATEAPGHRLTLLARRSLAAYDSDPATLLACHERLVELFPEDAWLQLGRLAGMRELSRREERLALLRSLCEKPGCHPVFWQQWALELAADARQHPKALRLLRRAMRCGLVEGEALHALANIEWAQGRFEEALDLYRLAACLSDKNEALATTYFLASHHLKRTDTALAFLQGRFRGLARRSGLPSRTLFSALAHVGRATDAFVMLEEALALRPSDGDLLLFAADAHARHGNAGRAGDLLAASERKSKRSAWLRTAAGLATCRGDLRSARALWEQVLEIEPLAIDAHAAIVRRLAETESRAAALDHLKEACERFPHHLPLHRLRYYWLRESDHGGAESVLRHIIAVHPVDAWARRELALRLGQQGRLGEAFAEAAIADSLEPAHPAHRSIYGDLCVRADRLEEARKAWREAIRVSVDSAYAIERLLATCGDADERREVLAFIGDELGRQTTYGEGLVAYDTLARGTLTPGERLSGLQGLLDERADLWQAWSALGRLLLEMDRRNEALDLTRRAAERFPLVADVWLDRARALEAAGEGESAVEALGHALQINPGLTDAVHLLADAHVKSGQDGRAKAVLEEAVTRDPLEPRLHAHLAHTLWRMGEKDVAITRLAQAAGLAPADESLWETLRSWSSEATRPALPEEIARDLVVRRPGEPACWIALAKALSGQDDLEERLAALDRAIGLDPFCVDAHDLKAVLLAETGRFEEARAACRPVAWGDRPPPELRGRAAWVEAVSGRNDEGMRLMRAVLEENPGYYWGWRQLAEWCRVSGANLAYLNAATRMVGLAPLDPQALWYRGHARVLTADGQGGKADWERALEIAPGAAFVAQSLFDAQMEDGEIDRAAQTLERHRPHAEPDRRIVMELCLAVARRDRSGAARAVKELCFSSTRETWPFEAVAEGMRRAGWGDTLEDGIKVALEEPAANPRIGALWADCATRWKRWRDCERRLRVLDPSSEITRWFCLKCCAALAEAGERSRLRRFLRKHGSALRGDNEAWGDVGDHLVRVNECAAAAQWLSDWRERRGLLPWMLLNLVVSLRRLGRDDEAEGVCEVALSLPADHTTHFHGIWRALTDAQRGDRTVAAGRLREVSELALTPYYRFLLALTRSILAVQECPAGPRRRAFSPAREELRKARVQSPNYRKIPELRRASMETVWRISKDVGGLPAMVWRLWRWLAG